ncbi:uncharacterized protein V1510DRAFT_421993 [Dipodascopsis tothii]|uniref:uncharacterized protein n=1 Tax=Dipodascopsis tothii TaxID=44089 RepID=UPI0034CE4B54
MPGMPQAPIQPGMPGVPSADPAPFMGASTPLQMPPSTRPASARSTAPSTPFQPMVSVPGTPLDLFLVTQTSQMPQGFFENFQPSQLFPEDTSRKDTPAPPPPPPPRADDDWPQPTPGLVSTAPSTGSTPGMARAPSSSFDLFDSMLSDEQLLAAGVSGPSSTESSAVEMTDAVPNSLNVGEWVQYLTTNGSDTLSAEMAELMQFGDGWRP